MKRAAVNANDVFDRLKEVMDIKTDALLAAWLGILPQALSNARIRNSIPWHGAVLVSQETGVSLDWIILGLPH